MKLPSAIAKYFDNSEYTQLIKRNENQSRQIRSLITEVQGATDITTNTESTSPRSYVGTPSKYSSYPTQVAELGRMYANTADWGCMIAKNVIDVRTAFSVGEGIKVKKRKGFEGSTEKELDWVKDFMELNSLDKEMPQEYAKEAEIDGKILFRLFLSREAKNIRVVHTSWRKFNYTITTPDYDYFNYINAKYVGNNEPRVSFDIGAPFFIYKRFGGNAAEVNMTPPKTAFVMREMIDLDKVHWDWRKINRLFSAPTPVIYCPDKQTAKEVETWVEGNNWRIGKLLILGGINVKYELAGWKGDGYTTLQYEAEALVKTISGTTGIPVHFLGYPELLSNRDTAENLIKLIALSTDKERHTWEGAYEELFQKSMILYNTIFTTNLNPMAFEVKIEEVRLLEGVSNAPVPQRPASASSQPDTT